jgi:hypothetical protein
MDTRLRQLGKALRGFELHTCVKYSTFELDSEFARRKRKAARSNTTTNSSQQPASFNLETYKFHALGDYVQQIKLFGVTGNYSTRGVSAGETYLYLLTIVLLFRGNVDTS